MNVRPWCWCWGRWQRLTGLSIIFFLLGVVIEYPFLISSHNPMQKNLFSVVFESVVRKWKIAFQRLLVSVHKALNFLVFESFPWLSIVQKRLVELLPMILQALLVFDSDLLRVMPLILCLRIFLAVWDRARLVFNAEISIFETSKSFPTWFISWSSVTINFDKHLMGFSRTFFSIKAENQNLLQMLVNKTAVEQNSTFQTQ